VYGLGSSVDLVHFEEDARLARGETVAVGHGAVGQSRNAELAGFVSVGLVGVAARYGLVLHLVRFEEVVDLFPPHVDIDLVVWVEFDEEDVILLVHGSVTHAGVVADETLMLRPFGPAIFQRFVEHEEERGEESCQESVEDDVEHQDQEPALQGTSEHLLRVGIVEELLESRLGWRTGHVEIVVLLVTHFVEFFN